MTYIQPPRPGHSHTTTVIFLHGRGSDGPEFAEEFFSSTTSKHHQNLALTLPQTRWVFPTAPTRWDTRFEEEMPAWFDVYSLTNIEERAELQVEGVRESVKDVVRVVKEEVRLVGGEAERVFLGGMSQGMAAAVWGLFCYVSCFSFQGIERPLGGFIGFCGWMPFVSRMKEFFTCQQRGEGQLRRLIDAVLGDDAADSQDGDKDSDDMVFVSRIPVLLVHGTDDPFVSVDLGRQAAGILEQSGMSVEWQEYSGADNDGHWIKEPEGFDDIVRFLQIHGK